MESANEAENIALLEFGQRQRLALHVLRQRAEVEVVGLVTTFNEAVDRVAMHAVRRELVDAQVQTVGLPLWSVALPWPCSNADYERRMGELVDRAKGAGVVCFAFGDLFLEDVRAYRVKQLAGSGMEPIFPLWGNPADTPDLARDDRLWPTSVSYLRRSETTGRRLRGSAL